MITRKRWTKEEEEILVQAIAANPHNIVEACKKVSVQLNRTYIACARHWYSKISPANNPTKTSVTFMTISSKTVCKNRKNSNSKYTKLEKSTLWEKLMKFIGLK